MSLSEIAFKVCTGLDKAGILAVLVGGSAAAFHAPMASMTEDLDFVLHLELFGIPREGIRVLKELGFKPTTAKETLAHEKIPYTLEILDGPLAVGAEDIETWDTHVKADRVLYVISPTVSVKDRLAQAIHFHDLSAARQAAEIAKLNPVDLSEISSWRDNEGGSKTYIYFERFLKT